jgi:hypothetical protein
VYQRTDRNDPCVVMDAYRYIVTLQQEVDDLSAELLECEDESCAHSETSDQQPLVSLLLDYLSSTLISGTFCCSKY